MSTDKLVQITEKGVRIASLELLHQVFNKITIYGLYPTTEDPDSFRTHLLAGVSAARTLSHRKHYSHLSKEEKEMVEYLIEAPYSKSPPNY